jgi:hypothetical protein
MEDSTEESNINENGSLAVQFMVIKKLLNQLDETEHNSNLNSEKSSEQINTNLMEYQDAVNNLTESIATLLEQSNKTKEELEKIIKQLVDTIEKKKQTVDKKTIVPDIKLDTSKIKKSLESIKKISENQGFPLSESKKQIENVLTNAPPASKTITSEQTNAQSASKTITSEQTNAKPANAKPSTPKKVKQYNEEKVKKQIDDIVNKAVENGKKLEQSKDETEQRKLSQEITSAMKSLKIELDNADKAKAVNTVTIIKEKMKTLEILVQKAKNILSGKNKTVSPENTEKDNKRITAIKGQFMDLKNAADKYTEELKVWSQKKKELEATWEKNKKKDTKAKKPTIPKRPEGKSMKNIYDKIKKNYNLDNNSTTHPTISPDLMKIYSEASKIIGDAGSIQEKYLKYKKKYMILRSLISYD